MGGYTVWGLGSPRHAWIWWVCMDVCLCRACVGMYTHVQGLHVCEGCRCILMGSFVWYRCWGEILMCAQHVWRGLGRLYRPVGYMSRHVPHSWGDSVERDVGAVHVGGVCIHGMSTARCT